MIWALLILVVSGFAFSNNDARAEFVLVANYGFDGTYSDTLLSFPDFTPLGTPTFDNGKLNVKAEDGLLLESGFTSGDFRIEVDLTFQSTSRWNKIIDFQNLVSDEGFYLSDANRLAFFNFASGQSMIADNQPLTVGMQKLQGVVSIFKDDVLEFSFPSASLTIDSSNKLYFLIDDSARGSAEGFIGTLDAVRLYQAVPEPSSLALATGVVLLAGRRWRKFRLCDLDGRSRSITTQDA